MHNKRYTTPKFFFRLPRMSHSRTLPEARHLPTLFAQSPQPLDFVLPGLKRASVGALISPGGTGKSYWVLQLAVQMALGFPASLTGFETSTGRVMLLSAEDDDDILAQRLRAIEAAVGPAFMYPDAGDDAQAQLRSALTASLEYRNCVGAHIDLMDAGWQNAIVAAAKPAGVKLIVFDTLSRFHALDENSAQDMKRLVAVLEQLARDTGASVLYLHHTSKATALSGLGGAQQAARGSSVLVDNVRWAAFLAVMTEGEARRFGITPAERELYVRWNVSKQNYAAPMPDRWFRRNDDGVLLPVALDARQETAREVSREEHSRPGMAVGPKPAAEPPGHVINTRAPAPPAPPVPSANNAFGGNW